MRPLSIYVAREKLIPPAVKEMTAIGHLGERSEVCMLLETENCLPLARIRPRVKQMPVTDGPYAETKEFAAG